MKCMISLKNIYRMSYLDQRREQKETGFVPSAKKNYRGLAPVSLKHQEKMKEYFELRDVFLKKHPMCQCGRNCGLKATDVHHTKSRGKYLLDISTWKALNRMCHRWATDNTIEAKKLGL